MKKIFFLLLTTFILSGCGTAHTNSQLFDAIFNTTSQYLEEKRARENCNQRSAQKRKLCRIARDYVFEDIK